MRQPQPDRARPEMLRLSLDLFSIVFSWPGLQNSKLRQSEHSRGLDLTMSACIFKRRDRLRGTAAQRRHREVKMTSFLVGFREVPGRTRSARISPLIPPWCCARLAICPRRSRDCTNGFRPRTSKPFKLPYFVFVCQRLRVFRICVTNPRFWAGALSAGGTGLPRSEDN